MLFRAVIKESHVMKEFLNTMVTLGKLAKECVMIISANKVNFLINEELTSIAPLVWTEITCSAYFDDYKMDGLDIENNQIFLAINPSNLARALQLLRGHATVCKIKLSNKQFPCLTVEIELPSSNAVQNRHIIHDVPIKLIPVEEWSSYRLPNVQTPNICLCLPNIRFIKNLVDKLKNLSPSVTFYGTNEGELSVVVETDSATICSRHRNLEIRSSNRDDILPDNSKKRNSKSRTDAEYFESSCLVDGKKAAMFLTALQVANAELSFSVIRNRLVQLDIEIGWGLLIHCIIPALCVS